MNLTLGPRSHKAFGKYRALYHEVSVSSAIKFIKELLKEKESDLKRHWELVLKYGSVDSLSLQYLSPTSIAVALFRVLQSENLLTIEDSDDDDNSGRGDFAGINKLIHIITNLGKMSKPFESIPVLFHSHVVHQVFPDLSLEFEREEQIIQLGQFYGLLFRTHKIPRGLRELLYGALYWRPPLAQPLIYEILKMTSDELESFDVTDPSNSLTDRVAVVCLMYPPPCHNTVTLIHLHNFMRTTLLCRVPCWTVDELMEYVVQSIKGMGRDDKTSADQTTAVLSLMCGYYWENETCAFQSHLDSLVKAWGQGELSDDVYAAVLKTIESIVENPVLACTKEQLRSVQFLLLDSKDHHYYSRSESIKVITERILNKIETLSPSSSSTTESTRSIVTLFQDPRWGVTNY